MRRDWSVWQDEECGNLWRAEIWCAYADGYGGYWSLVGVYATRREALAAVRS